MEKRILSSQVRAARALIGWSQEVLAEASGVSISTIRDFESGRRDASPENLQAMRKALQQRGGVEFLPDDDDAGPGVRLARENPTIIRKPTKLSFETENLPFAVRWRGEEVFVFLPRTVLADLERVRKRLTDEQYVDIFNKWEKQILARTARAIYAGRADGRGRLQLRSGDFEDLLT
jgi:transcriptional regulator with XRE-family HTH domain